MRIWQSIVLFLLSSTLFAQNTHQISGRVVDQSQTPLIGVNILVSGTQLGTATDNEGNYALTGDFKESVQITLTYVGYKTIKKRIQLNNSKAKTKQNFQMEALTFEFDEFIVKSTRVADNGPFTYTNIKSESIEKENLGQDVPILLQWTPSTVVTSDAGAGIGYTGIRIRGSDATRINVTINGIPLNDSESQNVFWVDLPDFVSSVNDIQIQRGVGTSTNGPGAFGASINLNTSKLRPDPYAEINTSYGSFNSYKAAVGFGSGLLKDRFTLEGRISKIGSDGFIDRAASDLLSWYASGLWTNQKSSLRLNAFSGHEVTYQAWCGVPAQYINNDSLRTYNPCGLKSDGSYYDDQVDDYTQTHYQALFNHQFNRNWHLNVAGHYTKGKGFYEEWKNNAKVLSYGVDITADSILRADLVRRKWLDNDFYGITYSLDYTAPNNGLNAILGGALNQYDGLHFGEVVSLANEALEVPNRNYYENEATKVDFNIFTKWNYQFTDKILGLFDLQYRRVDYSFFGFDDDGSQLEQSVAHDFFNPKLGANYILSDKSSLYASVSIANHEPNRSDYVDSSPNSRPKSEQLVDTELGFRMENEHSVLGINGYWMNYKNQLVLTGKINDVGEYTRINVPDSYRAGLEQIGKFKLGSRFSIDESITLSMNKIKSFTEYIDNWDNGAQNGVDHENTDIAFSPSLIADLGLHFDVLKDVSKHTLVLSLLNKYVGKQYIDNTSNENAALDAYYYSNFRINYGLSYGVFKDIQMTFLIRNLFGSEYSSNAWTYRFISEFYDPRPDDPSASLENGNVYNLTGYYPQAGRNFMVGLSMKF